MRAGDLRYRVQIQFPIVVQNQYGEVESDNAPTDWATIETRWGSLLELTSRELPAGMATTADVTHQVIMRHVDYLTPKHRLIVTTKSIQYVLNIFSVVQDVAKGRRKTTALVKQVL